MENVARAQTKSKDIRLSVQINSFKYPDGTQALSDMAVDVSHGEFIGILGSNGSGKTTLLKIMDGLMKDFEGSAYLDGTDIKGFLQRRFTEKSDSYFKIRMTSFSLLLYLRMWHSAR